MKRQFLSIFCLGCILVSFCSKNGNESAPKMPKWIPTEIFFDSLPGYYKPAQIIFKAIVYGDSNHQLPVINGDTLNYIKIKFITDNWVEKLNSEADTVWEGKVSIGQEFIFKPVFQLNRDGGNLHTTISLAWELIPDHWPDSIKSQLLSKSYYGTGLCFNHSTGEWFKDDD